jgi:site-specific DNA-methyltransferase (adenine-specific)
MDTNVLYYGDNLEILRKYIPDASVDLVYLDPPFNSNATYNVLFKEPSGASSQAQISAFEDTWHWGLEAERALQEIAASPIASAQVKEFMSVLPKLVGKRTDMAAYLTMMCIRLIELRRVLKDTGSIYLHCDQTASHYLKLLLDTIFDPRNFLNNIVWPRTYSSKAQSKSLGRCHDVIFLYSKTDKFIWHHQYMVYGEDYIKKYFKNTDESGRKYLSLSLTQKGDGPPRQFGDRIIAPPTGMHWIWGQERIDEAFKKGYIIFTKNNFPRYKRYFDELEHQGKPVSDVWNDIKPLNSWNSELLGYQTQKPEALLERIIKASSNEGDIVLDPFCGCGTAVVAAQKLNRKWIGIDITYLAVGLMEWRLKNMVPMPVYEVVGAPRDLASAIELANRDKYQFQWWAVTKIGGQPYGDKKKGADTGIDGYLYYMDEKDKIKKAIISVKGGKNINVSMIRDLGHVIDREKSDIGVFILLEKPTRPMIEEAAMKGFYHSPLGKDYPRIQIITIEEIFQGKSPDIPPWIAPIAPPTRSKKAQGKTNRLL